MEAVSPNTPDRDPYYEVGDQSREGSMEPLSARGATGLGLTPEIKRWEDEVMEIRDDYVHLKRVWEDRDRGKRKGQWVIEELKEQVVRLRVLVARADAIGIPQERVRQVRQLKDEIREMRIGVSENMCGGDQTGGNAARVRIQEPERQEGGGGEQYRYKTLQPIQVTIRKFDGSQPEQWKSFWPIFEKNIGEDRSLTEAEKYMNLEQYLEGEAKQIARIFLNAEDKYKKLVKELEARYGRAVETEWSIARAFDQVGPLPYVVDFAKYCQFRALCEDVVTMTGADTVRENLNRKIIGMIPNLIRGQKEINIEEWAARPTKEVAREIADLMTKHQGTCAIIKKSSSHAPDAEGGSQGGVAKTGGNVGNRRFFGNSSGFASSPSGFAKRGQFQRPNTNMSTSQGASGQGGRRICLFCEGGHASEVCRRYTTVQVRTQRLSEKRLCFSCGEEGHTTNACPRGLQCEGCGRRGHMKATCHRAMRATGEGGGVPPPPPPPPSDSWQGGRQSQLQGANGGARGAPARAAEVSSGGWSSSGSSRRGSVSSHRSSDSPPQRGNMRRGERGETNEGPPNVLGICGGVYGKALGECWEDPLAAIGGCHAIARWCVGNPKGSTRKWVDVMIDCGSTMTIMREGLARELALPLQRRVDAQICLAGVNKGVCNVPIYLMCVREKKAGGASPLYTEVVGMELGDLTKADLLLGTVTMEAVLPIHEVQMGWGKGTLSFAPECQKAGGVSAWDVRVYPQRLTSRQSFGGWKGEIK